MTTKATGRRSASLEATTARPDTVPSWNEQRIGQKHLGLLSGPARVVATEDDPGIDVAGARRCRRRGIQVHITVTRSRVGIPNVQPIGVLGRIHQLYYLTIREQRTKVLANFFSIHSFTF